MMCRFIARSSLFGLLLVVLALTVNAQALAVSASQSAQADTYPLSLSEAEQVWLAGHPKISIGIMSAWPPMDYVDNIGRPQGIGVEFIRALNTRLGNRLQIVPGPWKETYEAVKEQRLDALMDITPKPEREAWFHFTEPYVTVPHAIFARTDSPDLNELADLKGKRVGVERGFFIVKVLRDNYPEVAVTEYDSTSDALDAVAKGAVDVYIGNRAVATYIIETELIANIRQYGKITETVSTNAIGVRKDWPMLRDILQKALNDLSSEERRSIVQEWVESPSSSYSKLFTAKEQRWLESKAEIRVAAMDAWPPFNFVGRGGNPVGIGSAIVAALNQRLEGKLKIISGPWKEIYEKVKVGKLDAIMDITPKPAREEFFNFTTPYMNVPHVIVAQSNAPTIENEDDLDGKMLALEKGFGNVKYFQQNYPKVTIKEYRDTAHALDAVVRGEVDAYAGNRGVAIYLIEKELMTNLKIHGRLRKDGSILAFGTRKDWPVLRDILQKALDDISYNEHRRMLSKWVSPERAASSFVDLSVAERKWLSAHPVIRVSNEPDWPPYDFSEGGKPTGYAIDYMKLLADKLGVQFDFVTDSWGELYKKFEQGDIDLIHPLHYSEEREAIMYFTSPFMTLSNALVVRSDSDDITSLKKLHGKTLASAEGWAMTEYVRKKHPQIRIHLVKNSLEGLKAVQFGQADAWIDAHGTSRYLIDTHIMDNLKITGEVADAGKFGFVEHYIGVKKGWPILRDIMNKAISSVSADELKQLNDKWRIFAERQRLLHLSDEEREWLTNNPVIRTAIDTNWAPIEFVDNDGNYRGISADYLKRMEELLGVRFEVEKRLNWQESVAAFKRGELDVFTSVVRTPERESYISFTDTYTDFPISIFTGPSISYIGSMDKLEGFKVGVVEGYATHELLARQHPNIDLVLVANTVEALDKLSDGEIDAYVGALLVTSYYIGQNGYVGIKVAGETPYRYEQRMGVQKGNPILVSILNKALGAISKEERDTIYNRWVGVRYEHGIDYNLLWKILLPIANVIILLALWSWQLNRVVNRKTAELKASEAKFRGLIGNAPVGIVLSVPGGVTSEANPAMVEMFGYQSRDEFLAVPTVENYYDVTDRARFLAAFKDGVVKGLEIQFKHSDGSPFWGLITSIQQPDETGGINLLSVIEDISERKANEIELEKYHKHLEELVDARTAELRQSEKRFRTLVNNSPGAVYRRLNDTDWTIEFISEAIQEYSGYPSPDFIGNKVRSYASIIHPDDVQLVNDKVQAAVREKRPYELTYRIVRADNEVRWVDERGSAFFSAEGEVEWLEGIIIDVTERRGAEEKLKQSMDELERFNRLTVGREKQIIDLKKEINLLLEKLGQAPRFKSVE